MFTSRVPIGIIVRDGRGRRWGGCDVKIKVKAMVNVRHQRHQMIRRSSLWTSPCVCVVGVEFFCWASLPVLVSKH